MHYIHSSFVILMNKIVLYQTDLNTKAQAKRPIACAAGAQGNKLLSDSICTIYLCKLSHALQ